MPTEVSLPPALFPFSKVRYVQQVSDTEWSSTCLECGGSPHPDGSWPDRLRLFTDGSPRAWCRKCGWFAFADANSPPDPLKLAEWHREQIAREEARRRSAELALEHLRSSNMAERFHDALDAKSRAYWTRQGISPTWQDWWGLGWAAQHEFYADGQPFVSDAATIPIVDQHSELLNVKMRLEPTPLHNKYRYAIAHQPGPLFLTDPEAPMTDKVVICEGEKKAMVTWITLDDASYCVVGLPGATPSASIISQRSVADRVTIVLDPGARVQAWNIAKAIGVKKCRVLIPSSKIDDAILSGKVSAPELRRVVELAKPVW